MPHDDEHDDTPDAAQLGDGMDAEEPGTEDAAPGTDTPDADTGALETTPSGADDASGDDAEADTFPRAVVEKLRTENAKYRQRAKAADDLARRLHTALVAATGKLADPTDLEFDAAHLDDADALGAAIDDLITDKPHLRSRRPAGNAGQGVRGDGPEPVDLAGMLRARA